MRGAGVGAQTSAAQAQASERASKEGPSRSGVGWLLLLRALSAGFASGFASGYASYLMMRNCEIRVLACGMTTWTSRGTGVRLCVASMESDAKCQDKSTLCHRLQIFEVQLVLRWASPSHK